MPKDHFLEIYMNKLMNTFDELFRDRKREFRYVESFDSICDECEVRAACEDPSSDQHKIAQLFDSITIDHTPELEFEQTYALEYLNNLIPNAIRAQLTMNKIGDWIRVMNDNLK